MSNATGQQAYDYAINVQLNMLASIANDCGGKYIHLENRLELLDKLKKSIQGIGYRDMSTALGNCDKCVAALNTQMTKLKALDAAITDIQSRYYNSELELSGLMEATFAYEEDYWGKYAVDPLNAVKYSMALPLTTLTGTTPLLLVGFVSDSMSAESGVNNSLYSTSAIIIDGDGDVLHTKESGVLQVKVEQSTYLETKYELEGGYSVTGAGDVDSEMTAELVSETKIIASLFSIDSQTIDPNTGTYTEKKHFALGENTTSFGYIKKLYSSKSGPSVGKKFFENEAKLLAYSNSHTVQLGDVTSVEFGDELALAKATFGTKKEGLVGGEASVYGTFTHDEISFTVKGTGQVMDFEVDLEEPDADANYISGTLEVIGKLTIAEYAMTDQEIMEMFASENLMERFHEPMSGLIPDAVSGTYDFLNTEIK